jgi:signal transduction histidine kinase
MFAQQAYQFERINTESGLPANTIKGLQFDAKNRFLWIGTESGIVRYNGYEFHSFGDNLKNFKLNGRTNIFSIKSDNTLFGTLGDASIFTIEQNKAVSSKSGQIIKSAYDHLNYKYNLAFKPHPNDYHDISIHDFKVNGVIYLPVEHYLLKYEGSRFDTVLKVGANEQFFCLHNQILLFKNNGQVAEVVIDKKGKYIQQYIASKGLSNVQNILIGDQVKIFQNKANDPAYLMHGEKIYSILLENNAIHFEIITDQLPNKEYVRYLQIDTLSHTIYLGTDNRGMLVGKPRYFKRMLPNNIVPGGSTSVYAQVLLPNGDIQVNAGQLFGKSKIASPQIFNKSYYSFTFISNQDQIFFSDNSGLFEYDFKKQHRKKIALSELLANGPFVQLDSLIYTITPKGIAKRNPNGLWEVLVRFVKTPVNFLVFSVIATDQNNLLIATSEGLYKYNITQNRFKLLYKDKTGANFRTIFDLNGYYLLGTYGAGIFMYKNDTIKKLPGDPNGYLNFSHCFVEDSLAHIWISTNKGVFMTSKVDLLNAWNRKKEYFTYKYYGKSEGIDVLEMNGGCSPCAIKLPDGNISFPGIDGLIQFNPITLPTSNINPSVFIDRLKLNDDEVDANLLKNTLSSNTQLIEVELGISGMLSEENIIVEYNVDKDKIWRNINVKNPYIKFEQPNYGTHFFSIRWRNTIEDHWNVQSYNLSIAYPWYIHPYVYFAYFIFGCLFVLLYIQRRTIFYQKRQKVLEDEVSLKTNSLKKVNAYLLKRNQAKDHVIAIMNHDILTPLKYLHITAKNVSEQIVDEKAKKAINQIAMTTRELEYLTSNMLNWVKFDNIEKLPQKQSIDLYLLVQSLIEFVEPFKQNEKVKIISNVKSSTIILSWPDSLRVLLYNLLMNAIKATNEGCIYIQYEKTKTGYKIVIEDEGIGMSDSMMQYLLTGSSKDQVEQLPKHKKGNGVGYQIIRHIVQLMSAKIEIEKNKKVVGTRVTIHFTGS